MSEFQTVKRRGHSQNANAKYPEQHQQLVEMGFDSSSVSRALDASNGDMEAATAVLIGEGSHKNETEEKVVPVSKERKAAASTVATPAASTSTTAASTTAPKTARQSSGLAVVAAGQSVKDIKETHQRMIATYKVQKCKETGAHDRKMCMNYHSLSDRRRNPFEILYSCYECPNTVDGGECPDGDSCMHSHTMLERMFHPELYKISVCQRQLTGNKCDRAMLCAFAHNDADLRISPSHLTTKYAMQEEAKTTPVPVNQSAMLDHIRNNLVKLIREHGSDGVIAADLPKYYQGKFHESLDLIDESGKKYKLKDLIGPHNNIHVVLTGQPKFVFGDPSIAAAAAAESQATVPTPSTTPREASQTSVTATTSSQTVKDRVVELIKSAGAEGILATEMSKKYQERYGEKLEKDWNVGLNAVAGMVLTQTKQYTKYTFNAITAGIKDAVLPSVATKDGKSASNSNSASLAKTTAAPVSGSAPAQPTTASQSAPKWGSNAGKSFASILSAQGAAAAAAPSPAVVETVVEAPKVAAVEPVPAPIVEPKAVAPSPGPATAQKAGKAEKAVNEKASKSTNGAKLEAKASHLSESSEKDTPVETVVATPTPVVISENLVGASLPAVSSPSSSVGLTIGASPSVSRGTSDMGTLPKPLFGGLDGQLNAAGLDNQFSLGLGSGGSSSLLDLASASLTGILPSSFDLPLDGMDLGANSVLPPGLSKAIGKPTGVSSAAPSLSSLLGQSLGGSNGLGGLPLTSSSRDTPERNVSSGTVNNGAANNGTMSQAERLAYLERELAAKTQEAEAHAAEVSVLRARVNELEANQLNHDERLRSSIMEKDMELLTKHQEIMKYEEELRKSKEEKLVDLDQCFIYFSKIEEVINSMKCKEETFSDKVKPEDVQELFQFKKLIRNYVVNVKAQLKNKFDVVVAQTHLMRGSSGNAVVKDPSVEAVALGMVLPSGPPPGGLNVPSSGVSSASAAASSASTNVFGVLSSGASAAGVTGASTSRFAGSFDAHSMPFAHNHHHGLTNVGDAFSSSSVLFPNVTDLGVSSATATPVVTKQCGLPGCLKEGLYTCAGCRKISYCGEAHQR